MKYIVARMYYLLVRLGAIITGVGKLSSWRCQRIRAGDGDFHPVLGHETRESLSRLFFVLGRVHKPAHTQRLLSKVDQQAQPVITLMQVKQALLNIFGQDDALGLDL